MIFSFSLLRRSFSRSYFQCNARVSILMPPCSVPAHCVLAHVRLLKSSSSSSLSYPNRQRHWPDADEVLRVVKRCKGMKTAGPYIRWPAHCCLSLPDNRPLFKGSSPPVETNTRPTRSNASRHLQPPMNVKADARKGNC
jgi:hypothetical protein